MGPLPAMSIRTLFVEIRAVERVIGLPRLAVFAMLVGPLSTAGLGMGRTRKSAGGVLTTLTLQPDVPVPLFRQIYTQLREGILSGQLSPGTRLPSSRTLARELGAARNTVVNAFDQLKAEGYLEVNVGSGTIVARDLPD